MIYGVMNLCFEVDLNNLKAKLHCVTMRIYLHLTSKSQVHAIPCL